MSQLALNKNDFETAFGEQLDNYVARKIEQYSFRYEPFTPAERDAVVLSILETLNNDLVRAGQHRRQQWEDGWAQNVAAIKEGIPDALIPKYFGKYPVVRWRQQFLRPISKKFEYYMLAVIQDWLFDKYLRNAKTIYEFGCGTGHNLQRAREVNREATIWGLDWAVSSQEAIALTASACGDTALAGRRFDMFHPDPSFMLHPGCGVYTIAALEQTGEGYKDFISYLTTQRPEVCIHVEPIGELLDSQNLVDYLSLQYFKKRNYLSRFLEHLRSLEREGSITIHRAQRSYVGSLYIEGYSIVVWSPRV